MNQLNSRNFEELKLHFQEGLFSSYKVSELFMKNKFSELTPLERKLRSSLIDYIATNSDIPNIKNLPDEILKNLNLNLADSNLLIKELILKDIIVVDEDGYISVVYPVSSVKTCHTVKTSDKVFNAMCAIDSLGSTFTFNQDIDVSSTCKECGLPIQVTVENEEITNTIPSELKILHVDLSKYETWSCCCCNIMNFFCCEDHYKSWVAKNNVSLDDIFCLNAVEGLKIGKMLFDLDI